MVQLRVTKRCLVDDLGLPADYVGRDVRFYCHEHRVLKAFQEKRSQAPGEGENALRVVPYGHVKTLHDGRARALTLFDAKENVCWLLAYGATHAKNERRDVFRVFESLSDRGELLPTEEDYRIIFSVTGAEVIDTLTEIGGRLYHQACNESPNRVSDTVSLKDQFNVDLIIAVQLEVEAKERVEQGWVSFTVPPDESFRVEQAMDVLAGMLPKDVDPDSIEFVNTIFGRATRYTELAFSWLRYTSL